MANIVFPSLHLLSQKQKYHCTDLYIYIPDAVPLSLKQVRFRSCERVLHTHLCSQVGECYPPLQSHCSCRTLWSLLQLKQQQGPEMCENTLGKWSNTTTEAQNTLVIERREDGILPTRPHFHYFLSGFL